MLALIAGQGALPGILARRLRAEGVPFSCFSMAGFAPDESAGLSPELFRFEHFGSFLARLSAEGFTKACLAGAVRRPAVDPAAIDAPTRPLMERLGRALQAGDDRALREIIALFEENGQQVIGAHEIAPDLLAPQGHLATARPGPQVAAALRAARAAHAVLSAEDRGQALVVAAGRVLAEEGPEGTDALLAGLSAEARGGFLFKAPKAGQERRADLPVIGPETARAAAQAGLCGLVIEAGGGLLLERPALIAACDAAGLFLWAIPPASGPGAGEGV